MGKKKIKPFQLANAGGYDHIPSMHVRFGTVLKGVPSPANQSFTRRLLLEVMDKASSLIHQSGYSDEITGIGVEFIPSPTDSKLCLSLYDRGDKVLAPKSATSVTTITGSLSANYAHLVPAAIRRVDLYELLCFKGVDGWEKPAEGVVYFMSKSFVEELVIGETLENVGALT